MNHASIVSTGWPATSKETASKGPPKPQPPSMDFRLAFLTPPAVTASQAEALQRTTYSFRLLSPAEAAAIRPLRLRVVTVGAGDTPQALAERLPFEKLRLEWFETLNGLAPGQPLTPGAQVKIIAE